MAFLSAMFVGLIIGIGLVVAFARYEKIRSSRRSHMAKTVASFARMTVQDTRKILPPEFYPPWLMWLNVQLKKIWPYVNEAASELIRVSVEPTLEQYTPAVISSMKFGKLTLGTIAPQFTGVSIVESESGAGGITMELEMKWDGNPNIVLNINTRLGVSLPVQVKNFGFTGVFRLVFKPLVDQFPCFGAVSYSLREKKDLDFTLKVVGGDISTIPGISDAIEDTIRNAIEDSIMWPVRKIIPILPGDYSDLELKPVGTLDVKLVQAKDLANKDMVGKSDPFAKLFVRPLRHKTKTSKTINNTLNPIWNEHFEFIVEDASTQHLTVRVFDDEGLQAPELIGCAHVALKDLEPGKVKDIWLKLVKDLVVQKDTKNRGMVQLELLYCPFGTESSFKNPFNPDFSLTSLEKALKTATAETEAVDLDKIMSQRKSDVIVRGVLSVTVIAAEDLPAVDFMGKADPFVVITLKKSETKAVTRVANETLNPVWDQTFDFVVEDALHEMIILEVWDYDTLKKEKIGRCIMTLTRVLLEGEVQDSFPLDGAKSGKLLLHLKWSPRLVFRDA
ncbi:SYNAPTOTAGMIN HOMOLOG E, synaptotagmin 5, ARABIDOPSIS THALIANA SYNAPTOTAGMIN HOMOLOG E [Hibiscus trionum]|uniref:SYNAPTOTAGMIN HOMOLOG E, synaptotagmin 5, ARABIDOPSIS THALIANA SYNAPTOTAGMIN HOMOLOG E n=1 Tax=Hibiscus trionum TaxID=183268 RepID=A0A9W7HVV3_HIBTR|nr:SYNAPTOTAGMIN HOMOLOG E, synaptotagmin 5, ARABIDOPSIS THALIANA SYNAPTOTAGMIN HOMOLOG E [Hibiscus trionum]